MTREDIIFNIKYRIMALKSLSPKEQEENKGNLWELEDLLGMIDNDHVEDEPERLDEAAEEYAKRQGLELAPFAQKFFKAGAEWMAEQGIICEGRVSSQQGKRGIITTDVIDDIGDLLVADKVIVQIRKA